MYVKYLGSFSNDHGDGNKNVKEKATGLISKTATFKTLHVQHTFCNIPSPFGHDCEVKFPQVTFYGGCKQVILYSSKLVFGRQEFKSRNDTSED